MTTTTPSQPLRRRANDRILAGVCGGIADHTGIDPNVLRLLAVVLAVFGGVAIPVYIAAWLLIPEQGQDRSSLERLLGR